MRTVLVVRRRLLREGLALIIEAQLDIDLDWAVAEASAITRPSNTNSPDAAIVDDESGMAATARPAVRVREALPETRMIVLCGDESICAKQGVDDLATYVPYAAGSAGLLAALRSKEATDRVTIKLRPLVESRDKAHVSGRELQILRLIGSGATSREIAALLAISPKTVENHKQRIFAKMSVQNQAHAVAVAMRRGLLAGEASASVMA